MQATLIENLTSQLEFLSAVLLVVEDRIHAGAKIEQRGEHPMRLDRQRFRVAKLVQCVERHDTQHTQWCSRCGRHEQRETPPNASDREQRRRDSAATSMRRRQT